MNKTYKGQINFLPPNGIFVFGSNTEGRHGKGAALIARTRFGAIYGQAAGMQGGSYGIITKNLKKAIHPSVSKQDIISQIVMLYDVARMNPDREFYIAYSTDGKNLNGYTPADMVEMFASAAAGTIIPQNIIFEEKFYFYVTIKHQELTNFTQIKDEIYG